MLQTGPVMTRLESRAAHRAGPKLRRAPKPGRLQILSQPAETGQRRQPGRVRFAVLLTIWPDMTRSRTKGHGSVTLAFARLRADSNGSSVQDRSQCPGGIMNTGHVRAGALAVAVIMMLAGCAARKATRGSPR